MVQPGYLVVQYSIIKQEGSKTVQRNGIHVCTQASTEVSPGQTMSVVLQPRLFTGLFVLSLDLVVTAFSTVH